MIRKDFLAASATIAASSGVVGSAQIPGGASYVERRSDFDAGAFAEIVGRPATIRQVVESMSFHPSVLDSLKNSMNGLQFGFGYRPGSIAIAFAGHGTSSVYAYSDYVWNKYRIGEFFKLADAAGAPIRTNVYVKARSRADAADDPDDSTGMYQDSSLETLQQRGLIVLTCHTAVEEQARALVRRGFAPSSMSPQDVAADILTHLIAGAVVVPSMVATIAVLQSVYRYTYLTPPL